LVDSILPICDRAVKFAREVHFSDPLL
jgi:hypothetical protein